jgi:uncharacterized repeat protein (TIGR03803 family)
MTRTLVHNDSVVKTLLQGDRPRLVCVFLLLVALLGLQPTQAQTYAVLHSFTGLGSDGSNPVGGVIRVATGTLYGTTLADGTYRSGTVYEFTQTGKEAVVYSFAGGTTDGASPCASLIRDAVGNLYGVTSLGGTSGYGTVFKVTRDGKEKVLYSFVGQPSDGQYPTYGGLVADTTGNFYGVTEQGGAHNYGTVFKVTKAGKESVLHSFSAGTDGAYPIGTLLLDVEGNLYGTTQDGGKSGLGTVFKVTKAGEESVLYSFKGGTDGEGPFGGLVSDKSGNFYGTTLGGGILGAGTVFKVTKTGTEAVLYNFMGGTDGGSPFGTLVRDAVGNLYGTTEYGGLSGFGTIFELSNTGAETVLHSFAGFPTDGQNPLAGLKRDNEGNLYGTTYDGGTDDGGIIFKLQTNVGAAANISGDANVGSSQNRRQSGEKILPGATRD